MNQPCESNSEFGSEWCVFIDGSPVNSEFDNLVVFHKHPVIAQGFSLWIRRAKWNLIEIGRELATVNNHCDRTLALVDIELLENYRPEQFQLPIMVIAKKSQLARFGNACMPNEVLGVLSANSEFAVFQEALVSASRKSVYVDPYLVEAWNELKGKEKLTPRHIEIVRLVASGKSSKQIAALLKLSPKTVQNHRSEIMRRLSAVSAAEMISKATIAGWLDS